jgi:hypothetical protein
MIHDITMVNELRTIFVLQTSQESVWGHNEETQANKEKYKIII